MVKADSLLRQQHNVNEAKFKGVRKRKWGKYVSEIRLPNSRERIWLGSFDTAEKAARAFDAALFCLRGNKVKFNFPDNPPEIVNGRSLTPAEIQVEAARFANSYSGPGRVDTSVRGSYSDPGRVENLEHEQTSSICSSEILHVDSPSVSAEGEMPEIPLNFDFLNSFSNLGSNCNIDNTLADYGLFPGYDDLYVPEMPLTEDYESENFDIFPAEGSSFLWNF